MDIITYTNYVRGFGYMSHIDRTQDRKDTTQEYFTPTPLVVEMLDIIEQKHPTLFTDKTKTFLDNCCGDGQFLVEVVIRKMEKSGCTLVEALQTTYGVELMEDNVTLCRRRLMGPNPTKEIIDIVNTNIVCHDALTYDYSFNTTNKTVTEVLHDNFFQFN